MSAPTPADGGHAPGHGFYPDPSIPGYVRYWNGSSWVPGTSRPAPADGEPMPTPPPGAAPAPSPNPHSGLPDLASVPAPAAPSVEETGPFFFDEEEQQEGGQGTGREVEVRRSAEPAVAWQADTARQNGFGGERDRRVSWGSPAAPAEPGGRGASTPPGLAPAQGRAPAADPRAPRTPGASHALPSRTERPALEPLRSPEELRGQARPESRGQARPESRGQQASESPVQQSRPAPGAAAPLAAAASSSGAVSPAPSPTAPRTSGTDGTMAIRAVKPRQRRQPAAPAPAHQPPPAAAHQPTPGRSRPVPTQHSAPQGQLPAQARQSAPGQQSAQSHQPAQPQAHQSAPPAASWAQQVNQLATAAPEAEGQPVVPWKPPVEDVFAKAAREQAAARPAGLGRRFAARLLDTLVLGAVVAAVAVPLVTQAVDHIDQKIRAARLSGTTVTVYLLDATTLGILGIIVGAFLVLGVLYEAVPTARWGRTLGKKVFGLQVRDIEEHEPPRFGGALRRWLVYGVLGVLGIGVLNVLWCLVDRPWRQCWHDKAGRTFVAGRS